MRALTPAAVLAPVLALALAAGACSGVDHEPVPVWMPWDAIEGALRPEVGAAGSPAPGRDHWRVVTYNTRYGIEDDLASQLLADPVLATADVLLLQEADWYTSDGASQAARLAAALGMSHVFAPTSPIDGGSRGLAILARFALRGIDVMYLQREPNVEIAEAARAAVAAVIDTPSGPVRVINVHLDVALNIPERILQLRPAVLGAPPRALVAGDFNTNDYVWAEAAVPLLPLDAAANTSQADALDAYMRRLGFATPTAALGDTWRGLPDGQRLDAIFTRGLRPGDGGVNRALELSDHRPVWLDVEARPSP